MQGLHDINNVDNGIRVKGVELEAFGCFWLLKNNNKNIYLEIIFLKNLTKLNIEKLI